MAAKIQINNEDRDKLVELFSKINIENYDHDTSSEYAMFTRILKSKSVRDNYNIDVFVNILEYYIKNGLSLNETLSIKKSKSEQLYSFFNYAFSHPEFAKKETNTIAYKNKHKSREVIEAQTVEDCQDRIKDKKNEILQQMQEKMEKGETLSTYIDPDYIDNRIGCKDCISGYIQDENGKWKFCHCYLKEIFKTKCKNAGIPEIYSKFAQVNDTIIDFCALKNYNKSDDFFKGIYLSDFINRYVNNINKLFDEGWNLIIEGPTGSLKTTTSCILGKEAIKHGYSVLFTEMQKLRKLWTGEKLSNELESFKDKVYNVDLLILDDFGQEFLSNNSDYQLSEFDYLLRKRLSDNKKFIITTNATKEQIEKRYSTRILSLLSTKMMHLIISPKKDIRKTEDLPNIF